ncbi:hypothetical protein QJS10_CPB21g01282 [Acorus calamus]|uniref:Omega-3 fatty acid desaturase n=1 Tax=Acorus calamus TaxID=4465 RepID=A0AAV9C2U7_ACOCL|nr:hypothetical protein QJS10_CPB21g01282 [Acorus calamus]
MANMVSSECGLRPLPCLPIRPKLTHLTQTYQRLNLGRPSTSLAFLRRHHQTVTRVSAPLRYVTVEEGEHEEGKKTQLKDLGLNEGETESEEVRFDPGAPPPFGLAEIRAAIPKHCWVKDPWRSMSYVFRDVAIVAGLAAGAVYLNNWLVWPLYWVAQGTMFWALFVLGHDWRISHRTHHQNHGHVEKDESWHPWSRSPGKKGSHYHPDSDLFVPKEKKDVITSTVCWSAMAALLAGLTYVMGPLQMIKLYFVPYWIFVMWLDLVTYLHHHGHEENLPWYRGKEWSYLRGGLTTLDRDYGLINNIHHDIGTHVIHHLFPQIPHYNLIEATKAAKPVLDKYYREPQKSGPLPFHLFGDLVRSLRNDHYVKDTGDILYYQTDAQLLGGSKKKFS